MGMATSSGESGTASNITYYIGVWPPEVQIVHDAVADADRLIGEIIKALEQDHDLTVKDIDLHGPELFCGRRVTLLWKMNGVQDD